MKTLLPTFTVMAALCGLPLCAKEAPASGVSASGAIAWSVNPYDGSLNLVYSGGAPGTARLCSITSTANLRVDFSPDDQYVFVTDGTASRGIYVRLYRRTSGLKYAKVDFDFGFAVQRLALDAEAGVKITSSVLDRSYLKCLGWNRRGKAILELSGNGSLKGKRVEISGFECYYDPAARSFSTSGR